MKRFFLLTLTATLLLSPRPAHAAGWVDDILSWFEALFSLAADDEAPAHRAGRTAEYLDSLRLSPLGLPLQQVPDADTLPIVYDWPHLSMDPRGDLDRYQRLLQQTVLLTDPGGKLPLTGPAVRVIYLPGHRPAYFLDVVSRFAVVQEVPYDALLAEVIPVSPALPTIILVEEGRGETPGAWYAELAIAAAGRATVLHFGRPESLAGLPPATSVITTPLRSKESESFLAQALFGAELIDGRLAVTTPAYRAGLGYRLSGDRAGYRLPEQLGVDRTLLDKIDYELNRGIRYRAMPGAQMLVMKNGQVIYEKAFGHQTYRDREVNNADLYDLASVTKAAATTLAIMGLYDRGALELDKRVRDYLPEYKRHLVGYYRIDQLLTHHTGLQPNLPISEFLSPKFTEDAPGPTHGIGIGPGKWLDSRVPASIRAALKGNLEHTKAPSYRYSDLNYNLLQLVAEAVSGEPLDQFVTEHFYRPMGLGRIGFNPRGRFPDQQLVPTINEPWMRGGLLRGYVHDEGAALLGGVAGHAGLFANAHDLGQLFQLLNDRGTYNGVEYLRPETVALFTGPGRYNYRALGFDRLSARWGSAPNYGAGAGTIGHLGYTGTSVWADPENDLVFVLLTNRVHPNPANDQFQRLDIRNRVNRVVYDALNTWDVES